MLQTAWIILNNHNVELNQQTYNMTGISNFANPTQFRNVCCMFTIIHDNALDYYIGKNMASNGTVQATLGFNQ